MFRLDAAGQRYILTAVSGANKNSSKLHTATNVSEFLKCVQEIQAEWFGQSDDPYGPWFRGQQKAHWHLRPKLYRDYGDHQRRSAKKIEDEIREEFIVRAPVLSDIKPADVDDWEWYFLMQHFGAPTRLLDWTQGALIGLYFAVRDNPGFYDAAVWMLDPYELNHRVFGRDEVIPPSANVNRHDKELMKRWLPDRFSEARLPKYPIAIYPTHIARRISSQRSCFTIHGGDEEGLDTLARVKNSCLQKTIIPQSAMRNIRSELETCGIDETTIFPDLDGLSRCINAWWKIDRHDPPHKHVYARLEPSKVDEGGVGVFAIVNIKKSTPLFRGDNEEILQVKESAFRRAPLAIRRLYRDFTVFRKEMPLFSCPTNFNRLTVSWYINEPKPGESPNVRCNDECDFFALRDIKAGEELTVDYSTYSDQMPTWLMK
jgi:hypothetical protein